MRRADRSVWWGWLALRPCPKWLAGRRGWRIRDPRRPIWAWRAVVRAAAGRGAAHELGPGQGGKRALAPPHRRPRKLWSHIRHESGQALHDGRAPLLSPPFARSSRLGLSADVRSIQIGQAQLHALLVLGQGQELLPDAKPGPADEGLGRHPPGPELRRDRPPFCAVLMTPEDR